MSMRMNDLASLFALLVSARRLPSHIRREQLPVILARDGHAVLQQSSRQTARRQQAAGRLLADSRQAAGSRQAHGR